MLHCLYTRHFGEAKPDKQANSSSNLEDNSEASWISNQSMAILCAIPLLLDTDSATASCCKTLCVQRRNLLSEKLSCYCSLWLLESLCRANRFFLPTYNWKSNPCPAIWTAYLGNAQPLRILACYSLWTTKFPSLLLSFPTDQSRSNTMWEFQTWNPIAAIGNYFSNS